MDKVKVLMLGIILALIFSVAYSAYEENSRLPSCYESQSCLRICKALKCAADPVDGSYSKNPPYFAREKYYWWIQTKVSANASVMDVVVYDQLGQELMIEGVSFVLIEKPGPYNYTFEYGAYEPGGVVSIKNGNITWTGNLDENGVTFDCFLVYWIGASLEPHLEWDIGYMNEEQVKVVYLTVSTDTDPSGLQEFKSPGLYFLNAEATVEGIVESTGRHTSAKSKCIEIEVLEKTV